MKIPREKEGGKANIVCVYYIYIWLPLGGEVTKEKKQNKNKKLGGFSHLLALLCT